MTQKEFSVKVKEILDDYNTPIGATEGDMIKFKTHRIMELSQEEIVNISERMPTMSNEEIRVKIIKLLQRDFIQNHQNDYQNDADEIISYFNTPL